MPKADDIAMATAIIVDTPIPAKTHCLSRMCPSNPTRLSGLILSPVSSTNASSTHCRSHVSPAIYLTSPPSPCRSHTAWRFHLSCLLSIVSRKLLASGGLMGTEEFWGYAFERFPCSKKLPLLSLTDEASGLWGLSPLIKSDGHRFQERP